MQERGGFVATGWHANVAGKSPRRRKIRRQNRDNNLPLLTGIYFWFSE
jgi:hypothetical protein